ncbi:hypothetical protein GCM10011386_05070 [Parapedobacter defluvii]|uniref:Uncharacterized protein n=1 Tax=Parapedobacter defluvii TaxID=2045106 RepID=A0ABQ1L3I5_9SPHI|nr:hypothetical protein [Parapedobacter defluvii]GGC16237.1 hypothetical protein GCM10011386_05070 [Parapedobacter defluvii]
MKINNFKYGFIFAFLVMSLPMFAQRAIKEGKYKINERTLIVKQEQERLLITEEQNKAISDFKKNPKIYSRIDRVDFEGKQTVTYLIANTLGQDKMQQLRSSGYILVTLYPESDGSVNGIQLYTKSETGLTIEEIDKIIFALKEKITIEIPSDLGTTAKIAPVSQVIHFNKL